MFGEFNPNKTRTHADTHKHTHIHESAYRQTHTHTQIPRGSVGHQSLCSLIHSKKSQTTQAVTDSWLTHTFTYTHTHTIHTHTLGLLITPLCICVVCPGWGWEDKGMTGRQKGGGMDEREIRSERRKRWKRKQAGGDGWGAKTGIRVN